jgi:hypothetical protein
MVGEKAAGNLLLALAPTVRDEQGKELVAAYDPSTSPATYSDSEGYFYFANIAPGNYGLILDTVVSTYLLNDPGSNESIIVTLTSGQTIDLGEIVYDDLPVRIP